MDSNDSNPARSQPRPQPDRNSSEKSTTKKVDWRKRLHETNREIARRRARSQD